MIRHRLVRLACRTRLLTLEVATTGTTSLAATETGYSRAAGSFLDDGFVVGMEAVPAGFAFAVADVITGVEALTLTTRLGGTVEAAAGGRSLTVGLPTLRFWENAVPSNDAGERLSAVQGVPYIEEDYLPGALSQPGMTAAGFLDATPLYVLRLYGPLDVGADALAATADAILALFRPGTRMTLTNGHVAEVRGDVAPAPSQLLRVAGWAVLPVTIPLRLQPVNT